MTIAQEIQSIVRQIQIAKPRSRRKIELETRLCALRVKQLKHEIRAEKRNARGTILSLA